MKGKRVRFEQKRGHYLVVEGDPPFARAECDEFRLRMLLSCDIPGLLRPDAEEIDGSLSLRYPLSGTRMLSQAMRSEKWSMTDLMTAWCRLAEVMEDCRLYVLDWQQLMLEDDLIFAGEGWHDLRFVYVPVTIGTLSAGNGLESLLVRWMMRVTELDGPAVQQVLRTAASPDFQPAILVRLARKYLSEAAGAGYGQPFRADQPAPLPAGFPDPSPPTPFPSTAVETNQPAPSSGWRWFQPPSGVRQSLSGLLGDDPELYAGEEADETEKASVPARRQRLWSAYAAIGLSAVVWRFGFLKYPGRGGLLFSLGMTAALCAGCIWLWKGGGFARSAGNRSGHARDAAEAGMEEKDSSHVLSPAEGIYFPKPPLLPMLDNWEERPDTGAGQRTGRLSWESDRTRLLDAGPAGSSPAFYLEWETAAAPVRIVLDQPSFVIGRSREASRHVDETNGVSRAHTEFLRTSDGWTAKDLGSRNGTTLKGVPMVPYEPYPVQHDDLIELAGSRYRFKCGSPPR